ncbi:MAG: NAD-dependent malic enzyme [bacterium]|nr:NAD-dependent malic enzyme [bacterium]
MEEEALKYHSSSPAGKLKIAASKPLKTQDDLSLAYTPWVSKPCLEIKANTEDVWKYTNRGNTVAIISDGTAVLGLGNIGPEAGLPVMEGKSVLFKKFSDVDAYPLCLRLGKENYLEDFMTAVKSLEPNLGGINLEDIGAPLCFELQTRLDKEMSIPVFHDDQDGTAVIMLAALINSLKVVGKELRKIKILINGAGAAGISIARLLIHYGISKEQIFMCDSKGLITKNRDNLNKYKEEFAQQGEGSETTTLEEAIKGSDVFIGVSAPDVLSANMVKSMASDPIIFAAANPVPEIMPDKAKEAGAAIVATGRTDFPNQVNNVLGFPGIFRATLDTRCHTINKEMKIAAAEALAQLTTEPLEGQIKDIVENAYPEDTQAGIFKGENPLKNSYIIPKIFDLRVVPRVAKMVAKAAMESGASTINIDDIDAYENEVFKRILPNWQ